MSTLTSAVNDNELLLAGTLDRDTAFIWSIPKEMLK